MAKAKKRPVRRVLNCVASTDTEQDFTIQDARDARILPGRSRSYPSAKDLRETWWRIDDQGRTGACVGYATAYGVLRWHYVKDNLMLKSRKPSARFIWMANKETDGFNRFPTTFLEQAGTSTKLALKIAHKYGCVEDSKLPMDGPLSSMSEGAFYAQAARLRISSYHNLGRDPAEWRRWLAFNGPILTRLNVDSAWNSVGSNGRLVAYDQASARGGHAVCLVGYDEEGFIVRNSWGRDWGKNGFAHASNAYAELAFTEAYGAAM
ncbi:MAG: C1 family peptidase [Pseudomonadota bacterium]